MQGKCVKDKAIVRHGPKLQKYANLPEEVKTKHMKYLAKLIANS